MHHGDLQGKRIIFIVTINFIDGSAGNPCHVGMGVDAFNRLTIGCSAGMAGKGRAATCALAHRTLRKREGREPPNAARMSAHR
ncbi:hypothetical protein [Burkholderia lata]|uniref:hypothetical protein n=1 Tax=Burkholderia lata (strain ATCC 17760 / DSM 23089 / LMG 22485 / NCIMB 9086 / R18194 / 383) TaxID=482957 RepID=UPI00158398F9|nr:hypothetical protein [Burkholderia lata]